MTEPRAPLAARIARALQAPRDPAAIVVFRIAFGLLVTISALRFLAFGWVDDFFLRPGFHFKYWGFAWVQPLPAPWMHALFGALALFGVFVSVGLFYRAAAALLVLGFTYVQLLDVTTYLNHYYLVSLLGALLVVIPAHRAWSLDALWRPGLRRAHLPAWCTYLLRFQVAVVYVNAGLAKLTADWLLHAQPLNIWLSSRTSLPVVGPWLDTRAAAYGAAWAGFLFDTTVVLFLSWRRSRPFAYAAVIAFHAATWALFPIGMFPFIMTTAALVFFDPAWPRRLAARLGLGAPAEAPVSPAPARSWGRLAYGAAALYALVQIALPLRTHLYGGNVLWHEQGMRFSWRVMAREKTGSVTFFVRAPRTDRVWVVSPRDYLTQLQEREMSVQPDLILQLAHRIARDFAAKGHGPVEVRAEAKVAWNGRGAADLVDPTVDLARETDGLGQKRWILPAPEAPPVHLRSLRPAIARGR
jgi:hypothetical protein